MPLFARRPRLDAATAAALGLARREHVLAFQEQDGAILAATDHRIALLAPGELVAARPWHEVEHVTWDREASVLRVAWVDGTAPWTLTMAEPDRDLMTTVRARVQSTLVATASRKVGTRTVRVSLRRDLARDRLFLQHQYGQGLRADDPRVAAAVAELEAELSDDAGLPPDFASVDRSW